MSVSEGPPVSPPTLVRWGGLVAIMAGVLLVISEILALGFAGRAASAANLSGSYAFYAILITITGVLLPLGLVSLYAHQAEATGLLGLIAFFVAFAGTTFVAGLFWTSTFLAPALATINADYLRADATPGFAPSVIAFAIGWLLFGVVSLQARVYPPIAVTLLIIGAIISLIPLPLTTIVLGVAVAWLGFDLFTRMRARAEPEGPSRVR